MLSVILQSDVRHIDICNNNIDSLGAVTIAEYLDLESDPPIEHLSLGCNRLNDDDAILISAMSESNHTVTTSIGVKALLSCVFDGSNLNAISESNHTVTEIDLFDDNKSHCSSLLQGCIDRMLKLDRTDKILFALQDKDSLLTYLANLPVELIPDVLEFPRRVVVRLLHNKLNIVYSTMRWWNMPMLYSYLYLNCVKSDGKRKRVD